jgi:glycosyltransferase involved in cell wall biosynthesis
MKKLLIIGSYNENYHRNKLIIESLSLKFNVCEVNIKCRNNIVKHFFFLFKLLYNGAQSDYIYLIFPAYQFAFEVLLFKTIFLKKKIIYDAFISIYDTHVKSNKLISKFSFKSLYYYTIDFLSCFLADILIFDTEEHKIFFEKKFHIKVDKKKIIIPVIIDSKFIDQIKSDQNFEFFDDSKFNILFYGKYTALHGIKYIVEAAKYLEKENFKFILIGSGLTSKKIKRRVEELSLKNIVFVEKMNYEDLLACIKKANLCLGIFGGTEKAKRVVPNKVLDYLACRKLTITGRNTALERYFKDGHDLIYCNMSDGRDLAKKIEYAYRNYANIKHIENNAKDKIEKFFSRKKVIEIIKDNFTENN